MRRYKDWFDRANLCLALGRAVDHGVIEDYHLKGAGAIELRYGFSARATNDVDIELHAPLERIVDVFAAAIGCGWGDFTYALRGGARPVRDDAIAVAVSVLYLGRPWSTIAVDLAPAPGGDVADMLPADLAGFPEVRGQVRAMRPVFAIAQKIHAATTPDPPGYELQYARHVVDAVYMARIGVDRRLIRAACVAVFAARSAKDGRTWPPALALPQRWEADYGVTLDAYGMDLPPGGVTAAFAERFSEITGCQE